MHPGPDHVLDGDGRGDGNDDAEKEAGKAAYSSNAFLQYWFANNY